MSKNNVHAPEIYSNISVDEKTLDGDKETPSSDRETQKSLWFFVPDGDKDDKDAPQVENIIKDLEKPLANVMLL